MRPKALHQRLQAKPGADLMDSTYSMSRLEEPELDDTPIPSTEVNKVALRLKYLIEEIVPFEMKESRITRPDSQIITAAVVETALKAGKGRNVVCVVFCLLVVKDWFGDHGETEIWDANLYQNRETAAEVLAARIIENWPSNRKRELLEKVLLQRYGLHDRADEGKKYDNVIERAVDMHALHVISTSGYQQCVSALWHGWYVADPDGEAKFVEYKHKRNDRYWDHFCPARMRVPRYQNLVQVGFSFVYLALYTATINSINRSGRLDWVEAVLYLFTFAFVCDELAKFWKLQGRHTSYWVAFNDTLYLLVTISFAFRMKALWLPEGSDGRVWWNEQSYNVLAVSAPMFWGRILLFLDSFRFFGAMMVVLKVMMTESIIFFALLLFILAGFLQAFLGLSQVDEAVSSWVFIIKAMANSVMGSPDFEGFDDAASTFGLVLYYIYSFVIMVVLLNILIALYNRAYEDITGNALDQYMALFAAKTLRFVRARDENVFIPPLNLVEIFGLIVPFEWWMGKVGYSRLNKAVMTVIYAPLLLITAGMETNIARMLRNDRLPTTESDARTPQWDRLERDFDPKMGEWGDDVRRLANRATIEAS